jgi:hypothetical protein
MRETLSQHSDGRDLGKNPETEAQIQAQARSQGQAKSRAQNQPSEPDKNRGKAKSKTESQNSEPTRIPSQTRNKIKTKIKTKTKTKKQNHKTQNPIKPETQQPTCQAVPSLYAVLAREAAFQNLVDDAYARQEIAIEEAYGHAPELATGDMTDVYKRTDAIRAKIAKSTREEIEELEEQSRRNCEKFASQQGSYSEKAREYVIGLIAGTVLPGQPGSIAGEVTHVS